MDTKRDTKRKVQHFTTNFFRVVSYLLFVATDRATEFAIDVFVVVWIQNGIQNVYRDTIWDTKVRK